MLVRARRHTTCVLAFATVASLWSGAARADEPLAATERRIMRETGEVTTVVDAFDDDNPFDLHLLVGFRQRWKSAKIRRETTLAQPGLSTGGYTADNENIANYSQSQSILDLGADIGLYKDLALLVRLPLILNDSRELTDLNGSANNPERLRDPSGGQLFTLPFRSPNRSGVDYISLGLNYAVMNQQREPQKPTWVVGAEGRFGIGPRLHACNDNAAVACPDPANPTLSREPGISRGTNALVLHTVASKRWGSLEPYAGFRLLAEFPQGSSDFRATPDVRGVLLNRPPIVATFSGGLEVIPWENREQFQRMLADFRLEGSYHSPGREYTELFDALGSSSAPSLRSANPASYHIGADNRSVPDPSSSRVYFNGITDQQGFGSVRGSTSVTWQAGKFVKFNVGGGLTYVQSHLITAADACNPNFKSEPGAAGPCRSGGAGGTAQVTGVPNPHHRPVIDLPGRRFRADDTILVDLWLSGVVMF